MPFVPPVFVVMVAMACQPEWSGTVQQIRDVDTMLREQAFAPSDEFADRVRVVFGVNRQEAATASSVDDQLKAQLKGEFPNAFGFSWCAQEKKFLFPQTDEQARSCGATVDKVPMCGVRETIKNNQLTSGFLADFDEAAPVYVVTMDADALDLRSPGQKGILQQFHETIKQQYDERTTYPRIVSCGFRINKDEVSPSQPVAKLAVELEMRLRDAVSKVIPYSAYFPEPASAFLLPAGDSAQERLEKLSFFLTRPDLATPHTCDGGIESIMLRQSVQNLRDEAYDPIQPGDPVFNFADKGIITSIPNRWKIADNEGDKVWQVKDLLEAMTKYPMLDIKAMSRGKGILAPFGVGKIAAQDMGRLLLFYDPLSHIFGSNKLTESSKAEFVTAKDFFRVIGAETADSLWTPEETEGIQTAKREIKKQLINVKEITNRPLYEAGDDKAKWAAKVEPKLQEAAQAIFDTTLKFVRDELVSLEFNTRTSALVNELEEQPNEPEKHAKHTKHAHFKKLHKALKRHHSLNV